MSTAVGQVRDKSTNEAKKYPASLDGIQGGVHHKTPWKRKLSGMGVRTSTEHNQEVEQGEDPIGSLDWACKRAPITFKRENLVASQAGSQNQNKSRRNGRLGSGNRNY